MESSNNVVDDYIFEEKGKFIVKKFKSKNSIIFGKFNSCDVARAARKILLDSNWELNNDHEISFYDVYKAVESLEDDTLFHFHENPNILCPVGKNIHFLLGNNSLCKVQIFHILKLI